MILIEGVSHVVFDIDGTLYDKKREYVSGAGSIEDAHEFFRYCTFLHALNTPADGQSDLTARVVSEYRHHVTQGTLLDAIDAFPSEAKSHYNSLVDKHGSNGKVFVHEFGYESGFFAGIVGHVDFEAILAEDYDLEELIASLQHKGYALGILTTETYKTAKEVCRILGIPIENFEMDTETAYPIFCSENVKEKKPSPEGFHRLVKSAGVNSPEKILYVGDSISKDVGASLRCGLQAAHVTNDGSGIAAKEEMRIGDRVVPFTKLDCIYQLRGVFD